MGRHALSGARPDRRSAVLTFDPSTNVGIVALRHAWPDRSDLDRPDWIVTAIGDDGAVQVRPLTFDDLVAWVERLMERAS